MDWTQNSPDWRASTDNTPSDVDRAAERNYDYIKTTGVPHPETDLGVMQIAGQSPPMTLQHVDVLVKMMEMGVSEKICT